jgi:hypothetical protein
MAHDSVCDKEDDEELSLGNYVLQEQLLFKEKKQEQLFSKEKEGFSREV